MSFADNARKLLVVAGLLTVTMSFVLDSRFATDDFDPPPSVPEPVTATLLAVAGVTGLGMGVSGAVRNSFASSTSRVWFEKACEPVDPASLNFFRAAFGVLVLAEIVRYFAYGWIGDHYLKPELLFKYYGFEWVSPWPGNGLYWHFGVMALFAAMIAVGFLYRIAAVGFLVCFAYVFLLEQANYLNHYYLVLSAAFILCFVPAERGWSVDARLARPPGRAMVPRWSIWALRLQFELVLIYAALVKINPDWLRGEPLGLWFAEQNGLPLVGSWLQLPGISVAAAWAVLLLHMAGALLLLHRRSPSSGVHSLRRISSGQLHPVSYRPLSLADAGGHADVLRSRLAETGVVATRWEQAGRTAACTCGFRPVPAGASDLRMPRGVLRVSNSGTSALLAVPGQCRLDRRGGMVRVAHEARRQTRSRSIHRLRPGKRTTLGG